MIQIYFKIYTMNIYLKKKITSYPEMVIPKGQWIYTKDIFKDSSYSSKIRIYY